MVTENVETDLNITNGVRGTVVGMVYRPDEEPIIDDTLAVKLQHLPLYILVKMDRTRTSKLTDLEESVIPVEPAMQTLHIRVNSGDRKNVV